MLVSISKMKDGLQLMKPCFFLQLSIVFVVCSNILTNVLKSFSCLPRFLYRYGDTYVSILYKYNIPTRHCHRTV